VESVTSAVLITLLLVRPRIPHPALAGSSGWEPRFRGGQTAPEVNYALTKNALASLAKSGYQGALFFHLRIWVPGFVGKAAQEDPAIAQYLSRKENLYTVTVNANTVTVDANAGVARVWQVKVEPGRQTTVKEVFSAPMNPTWLSLFKRSL
jgi:hypothetical protein